MDNQALLRRLRKTFLGEFEELVGTLERHLLAVERGGDPALEEQHLRELFRAAHSLKGAARAVELDTLVGIAHELESELETQRATGAQLAPATLRRLFEGVDRLKAEGAALELVRPNEQPLGDALAAPRARVAPQAPAAAHAAVAAAERPYPAEPPSAAAETSDFVRLSADQLDRLVALASELLVVRRQAELRHDEAEDLVEEVRRAEAGRRGRVARKGAGFEPATLSPAPAFDRMEKRLGTLTQHLSRDARRLEQLATPLEREILRVRMMPFSQACEGLDRAVRDLAHEAGKSVRLEVKGQELELDRAIARGIRGALLHLLRNAVSHGIESEQERLQAGKPATGVIRLRASLVGGRMDISVSDDGRGLDAAAIRARASDRGITPDADEDAPDRLIFTPGFSTAPQLTTTAGRGIGLDAVAQSVSAQRGRIAVENRPGAGVTFTLSLPLSLATLRALLVRVAGQVFALDTEAVRGLRRIDADDVHLAEGREMLFVGDAHLPVLSLAESLGLRPREAIAGDTRRAVVELASGTLRAAFLVDEFVGELPVLVKDLGPRLQGLPYVKGGTILDSGAIGLILDASRLLQDGCHSGRRGRSMLPSKPVAKASKRILLADDSVTTRALVRSILEAAGYDVVAVADGAEAWDRLQDEAFDLLVSDVEMPRMDGFLLTESVRQSRRLRQLPVILVTARESDADRLRGAEAGADAYLGKSAFDQTQLLQTVEQIL